MAEQRTPTTEDIRENWADGWAEGYAQFDRWLREHDAALIESLADEIVVEPEADLPDDFLRGFDTGADAVYAALREKARERREGVA